MKKFKSNYKIAILGNGGHASVCLDILKIHKKEPFCYITLTKEKNNSITSSLLNRKSRNSSPFHPR